VGKGLQRMRPKTTDKMTIVVRSVAEQAYQLIRERILSGGFEPGAPVRQDTIAIQLGVSKIPIREALTRLIEDGLVASHPNRGFVVRPLSTAEAQEVFLLRLKLEPDATAHGALNATAADHKAATAILVEHEAAVKRKTVEYVSLNRRFHLALVRPGIGEVTYNLLDRLNTLAERYVIVHLEPVGRDERAEQEHRALLAAWARGDADSVLKLASGHIAGTLRDLRHQLGSVASVIADGVDHAVAVPFVSRNRLGKPKTLR